MSKAILAGLKTSDAERRYTALGVAQDLRRDGRGKLDYRPITVVSDVLPQANGSSRVTLGHDGTDVIASVKVEIGEPKHGSPDKGWIEVSVDVSNSLFPTFDDRSSEDVRAALGGILQRVIGDCDALDVKGLCLVPGKFCWVVGLDLLILQADGNLIDACSFAAYVALCTAMLPKTSLLVGENNTVDDFEIDGDITHGVPITGVEKLPICISLSRIGGHFVIDPCSEEETCVQSRVVVAVDHEGFVCGTHKEGAQGVPVQHLTGIAKGSVGMAAAVFADLGPCVERSRMEAAHGGGWKGGLVWRDSGTNEVK
ncbi:unnamed protein product [Chrysoparadoxa australica]